MKPIKERNATALSLEREYKKAYIKLLTKAAANTAKHVDAYFFVKKENTVNLECGITVQQRFLS